MKQCTQCTFENIRNRFYCEQCGALLPSSTPQQVKTSTPRSHASSPRMTRISTSSHSSIPEPDFITVEPYLLSSLAHTQKVLYTMTRILLYLLGSLIAAFGLFTLLDTFTKMALPGSLALFLVSIVLLLITFGLQRSPLLNGRQRFLGELAAIGIAFLLLIIGAIIVGSQSTSTIDKIANIIFGCIILTYGIAVATLALW